MSNFIHYSEYILYLGQGANQALLDAISLSKMIVSSDIVRKGRRPVHEALKAYEIEMSSRSREKVLKSRSAASYLHSPAALATGDITRAAAAELYALFQDSQIENS